MFENVGYSFDSIEDVLIFVDWLQENFEDAEEFEEFLVSKVPAILEAEGNEHIAIIINPCSIMDEEEDSDDLVMDESGMWEDALFWDIISHEYHHKDSNGSTIFDTN